MTTITRKAKRSAVDLTNEEQFLLLKDYMTGEFSYQDLADRYNMDSSASVKNLVDSTISKLNLVKETKALNPKTQSHYTNYKPTNLINEPFLELLSPPGSSLTDEEMMYAYLFVFTGDNASALEQSGLDAGCNQKRLVKGTPAYEYALRVRGLHLRNKPNVKSYIDHLRESKLKDSRKVDKTFIIEELVLQLEQMKEEGKERRLILDTIKLLGQTCSAFTERIEISNVDPTKPIDTLIEMAMREAAGEPLLIEAGEYSVMEGST